MVLGIPSTTVKEYIGTRQEKTELNISLHTILQIVQRSILLRWIDVLERLCLDWMKKKRFVQPAAVNNCQDHIRLIPTCFMERLVLSRRNLMFALIVVM